MAAALAGLLSVAAHGLPVDWGALGARCCNQLPRNAAPAMTNVRIDTTITITQVSAAEAVVCTARPIADS
jgi:hypothetical protein